MIGYTVCVYIYIGFILCQKLIEAKLARIRKIANHILIHRVNDDIMGFIYLQLYFILLRMYTFNYFRYGKPIEHFTPLVFIS